MDAWWWHVMRCAQVMFDYNPSYNPPYYDSSIERLYDYYEHNPELGTLGEGGREKGREGAGADAYIHACMQSWAR